MKYEALVHVIRRNAVQGLTEVWGIVHYRGGEDYRLSLGRYRVIGVYPLATELGVLLEVRKILAHPEIYLGNLEYDRLEDAIGYVELRPNYMWVVRQDTDLDDPYVDTFLSCGIRLMVAELRRRHPQRV